MTIELYFSNRLDGLADKMSDILYDDNSGNTDPFESPTVIVPNANLSKWLQLFLAKKMSIVMNLNFQFLEAGLWSMLSALDLDQQKPELLNHDRLKIMLLYVLHNLSKSESSVLPVIDYLMEEDGGKGPDYAARLWQLCEKLAHLFQEYEFHRNDMIREWLNETSSPDGMALCQKQIYLYLKGVQSELEKRTGQKLRSIMEYSDEVFSRILSDDAENIPNKRSVHFFGMSQISEFHLKLIGRLEAYYPVFIYALNPSKEFWEDIQTPREKQWFKRKNIKRLAIKDEEKDQGELFSKDDNALLAAWGKPGRESIRLLCELTDYDFNACYETENAASSILQITQQHLLSRASANRKTERIVQDRSLQIVACPSVYREVETVFNSILFNLEQSKHLQLTDIAILVPDMSTYKPVFDSVFNRNPRSLAYNLIDSHAEIESVYGKAILSILKLVAGRFSRSEVFDLILNPCFASRWKISEDEVRIWSKWTEALNIFHSFAREASISKEGPPGGAYTWKQGLQRLRLSRILGVRNPEKKSDVTHFQQLVPFHDIYTGDRDAVEKFCMIVEAIYHAVQAFKVEHATGESWKRIFFSVCDRLIEIPKNHQEEVVIQRFLYNAFDQLALYDQFNKNQQNSALDVDLIKEFIRGNLRSVSGGRGNYLTGGVTISAILPMRPIPFRLVYVLGMEEGNFPGKADTTSLDLRSVKRRIGDISIPERNCYLFLEVLLSVKEKLYISYIAKDLQKDRLKQPCSVVNQLKRYIEQEILAEGAPFKISETPLTGSSPRYLASDAINDWSDILVNYNPADRLAYYRKNRLWKMFAKKASSDELKEAKRFYPDLSFERITRSVDVRQVEKITSRQLKKFLEDPVRQKIQRHMEIYDEEETIEDLTLIEDEPFYSEFPLDYFLKTDPIKRSLDAFFSLDPVQLNTFSPEDMFDRVYAECRRKSQTPEGAFADMDKNELRRSVSQIADTCKPVLELMNSAKQRYRAVYIGEQMDDTNFSKTRLSLKRFAPVPITIRTELETKEIVSCNAELHGQLSWVWQDDENIWHTLVLTGTEKKTKTPDKYVFEPVIAYMLCLLGEEGKKWINTSGITVHIGYREKMLKWTFRFTPETAKAYLTRLVSDYLNRSMTDWLPFEQTTQLSIKPHQTPDDKVDEVMRIAYATELQDAYSTEEDYLIRLVKPTVPADAFDRVRNRFQIFFKPMRD